MGEHDRIWLEPKGAPDRCWCEDNQWGDDGTEYVRADLASPTPSLPEDVERVVGWLVDRAKTHEELAALGKQAEPWPDLFHEAAALIQSLSSQLAEARAERDQAILYGDGQRYKASNAEADRARLAAENERLRESLEPFAERYDAWGDAAKTAYSCEDYSPRLVADLARARAALDTAKGAGE